VWKLETLGNEFGNEVVSRTEKRAFAGEFEHDRKQAKSRREETSKGFLTVRSFLQQGGWAGWHRGQDALFEFTSDKEKMLEFFKSLAQQRFRFV
jgi:hypothetical protein